MSDPNNIDVARTMFAEFLTGTFRSYGPDVSVDTGRNLNGRSGVLLVFHGAQFLISPTNFVGDELVGDVRVGTQVFSNVPLLSFRPTGLSSAHVARNGGQHGRTLLGTLASAHLPADSPMLLGLLERAMYKSYNFYGVPNTSYPGLFRAVPGLTTPVTTALMTRIGGSSTVLSWLVSWSEAVRGPRGMASWDHYVDPYGMQRGHVPALWEGFQVLLGCASAKGGTDGFSP